MGPLGPVAFVYPNSCAEWSDTSHLTAEVCGMNRQSAGELCPQHSISYEEIAAALVAMRDLFPATAAVTVADVLGRSREHLVCVARDAFCLHLSSHYAMSAPEIGAYLRRHRKCIGEALKRARQRQITAVSPTISNISHQMGAEETTK